MVRRIIAVIIAASLFNCLIGCTCATKVPVDEIKLQRDGKVEKVILKSGEVVKFDEDGGRIDKENQIIKGYVADEAHYGTLFQYKFDEIDRIQYRSISTTNSILTVGLVLGVIAAAWSAFSVD